MKHILTVVLCFLLFSSCKKQDAHLANDYFATVKKNLHDSISVSDFGRLQFSSAILSKVDSVGLYLVRIPFIDKNNASDFVLLQTDKEGKIKQGRIVHLEGKIVVTDKGARKFNGSIVMQSFTRELLLQSPIENGFITAYSTRNTSRTNDLVVPGGNVLPVVVISTTVPSAGGGISWATWVWLQSLFNGNNVQPYYSFFSADSGGDPWGSGGGGGNPSGGGGPYEGPIILVDFESQDEQPELDLQKVINCFNAVPNAGSHCSIEILTDIPVDADPNIMFDLSEKAPGHVFLKLSKHNGAQQVEQYLGFYPKSGYKAITYAPVASKLSSNALHEYNASISMNITPEKLATALSAIQLYSGRNYDVDQYNCTDFALDVFNSVRGLGLSIPLYGIPGSPMTQATRTPGGLYNKLKQMWDSNDPEKPNIVMGAFKGFASVNYGCN